jgi:hypothetical protein
MSDTLYGARLLAGLTIAAKVAQGKPQLSPYEIARDIRAITQLAIKLHKRYKAACNYEWATTDAYERRTDKLEVKAQQHADALGVILEFQHDPRGWSLILYKTWDIDGTSERANQLGRLG